MKNFHPFFIIGTLGMMVTSILHLFLSLILSVTGVHSTFFVIYPTFLTFLLLGWGMTLKRHHTERPLQQPTNN